MPSAHQRAVVNSLRTLRRLRGVAARYERNGIGVSVTLIPHTADRHRERDDHIERRFGERTWLLQAKDLSTLADSLQVARITPEAGDLVILEPGTPTEQRTELAPVANGEAVAMPHDTAAVFWRLQTHLIDDSFSVAGASANWFAVFMDECLSGGVAT